MSTATRVFYDFEFHDDGRTIDPISIGMVADRDLDGDGTWPDTDTVYLVNIDADWSRISEHPWLSAHVLPHLPGGWVGNTWRPDSSHPAMHTRGEFAEEVGNWLATRSVYGADRRLGRGSMQDDAWNRADLELWAYYGAYDHVALAQLWGPMIHLPRHVPMFTHDLCQLAEDRGVKVDEIKTLIPQPAGEHDALADALWNLRAWRVLTSYYSVELGGPEAIRKVVTGAIEAGVSVDPSLILNLLGRS